MPKDFKYIPKILAGFEEDLILTPEDENFIYTTFNLTVDSVSVRSAFPMHFGGCIQYTEAACSNATSTFPGAIGFWLSVVSFSRFGLHTGMAPGAEHEPIHQIPVIYFKNKYYLFDFSNFSLDGLPAAGTVYVSKEIFHFFKRDLCESNVKSMGIVDLYFCNREMLRWPITNGWLRERKKQIDVLNCLTLEDHQGLISHVFELITADDLFYIKPSIQRQFEFNMERLAKLIEVEQNWKVSQAALAVKQQLQNLSEKNDPDAVLNNVLLETIKLLRDPQWNTAQTYKQLAATLSGSSRQDLILLGAAMMILGMGALSLGTGAGIGLVVGGGTLLAIGAAFFSNGRQKGLSKAVTQLADVICPQEHHEASPVRAMAFG